MKRAFATQKAVPRKKAKVQVPEYHLAAQQQTAAGEVVWPAPQDEIDAARAFIREW
jgi:hypothetical protein